MYAHPSISIPIHLHYVIFLFLLPFIIHLHHSYLQYPYFHSCFYLSIHIISSSYPFIFIHQSFYLYFHICFYPSIHIYSSSHPHYSIHPSTHPTKHLSVHDPSLSSPSVFVSVTFAFIYLSSHHHINPFTSIILICPSPSVQFILQSTIKLSVYFYPTYILPFVSSSIYLYPYILIIHLYSPIHIHRLSMSIFIKLLLGGVRQRNNFLSSHTFNKLTFSDLLSSGPSDPVQWGKWAKPQVLLPKTSRQDT